MGKGIYRAGKGKGAMATSQGRGINRAGEEIVTAGHGNKNEEKTTKLIFNTASFFN